MDPSRRDILPYTASCNPPRRAKRPSTAGNPPTGTDRAPQPLPALAPTTNAPSIDGMKPIDDEDNCTADVPLPKRRGRKPSSLSRAARESMRRQNHSRIEKARRTKINEALGMLRDLVPPDAGQKHSTSGDESVDEDDEDDEFSSGKKPAKGKQQRQEKEFKLEILEKAVVYVQELQEKVRVLETRSCARCSDKNSLSTTHHPKRKREAMPPSDGYDSPSSVDVVTERPMKRFTPTRSVLPPAQAASNTRLPSISSWLPKTVADSVLPGTRTPPSVNPIQLPTPPASVVIAPILSPQVPPALRLELPMASLSARNAAPSVSSSPAWTPEDESIASLLLRIKTSSSPDAAKHGASVHDLLAPTPGAPGIGGNLRYSGVDEMRVQTPGSLLGLTTDGPK
jgi:Helix-loop-helix DNA-binding domain